MRIYLHKCAQSVLSAALANGVIIILMSRSLQVIVRYNTHREKESKQLIEDILQQTGEYVCDRQKQSIVHKVLIFQIFFPFISAELHV